MKKYISIILIGATTSIATISCEDKLNQNPQGFLAFEGLNNENGVDGLLVSAYSALDGWFGWGVAAPWGVGVSNWIWGDVASDDAAKGGGFGDQSEINLIEQYKWAAAGIPHINDKWVALYEGVARSNDAINGIRQSKLGDGTKLSYEGEARFLRAFFHFEAKKIYDRVPFIDETKVDFRQPNDADIWPFIEADLEFAIANLPADQGSQKGKATSGAAQALLAKVHLFQKDYTAAKPLLDAVINSGKYDLHANFEDNFRMATENGVESVFAYQSSADDGTRDADHANLNGNWGDILAHPSFAPFNSPGMQQPTYNLVNAFKTGADGLPLFDTYNDVDINNEMTTGGDYTEYTEPLDPRLDFTVGRRGLPFLGYGDHPGIARINDEAFYGPYTNRKNNYNKAEFDAGMSGAGWSGGASALNYNIIRFADVLLWRAEVAVEENDLTTARQLVNRIRERAKNGAKLLNEDGTPAANYVVEPYPDGHVAFSTKENARKTVQWERRLELALEGHRFFDLVRWGIAAETLNNYIAEEKDRRPSLLNNANVFDASKHVRFPIPLQQIEASKVLEDQTLTQNPGY